MSLAPLKARQIERRSLRIGVYASACMAVAGVCVHVLSGSYALLLDGLYSAVMVGSGLVASRISRNVVRPPDRAYPYGYDGQEALYVLFRSLVLIGVLSFAAMSGLSTLIVYASGRAIAVVTLGPVALYSTSMVAICWGLAWRHHHDWLRSGRQSQLLLMEAKAARMDALISGLTGIALLGSPLLTAAQGNPPGRPQPDYRFAVGVGGQLGHLERPFADLFECARTGCWCIGRNGGCSQHSTRSGRLAGRVVVLAARPHRDAGGAYGLCGGVSQPKSTDGWCSHRSDPRTNRGALPGAFSHAGEIGGDVDRHSSLLHDRRLLGSGSKDESSLRCLTGM